MIAKTFYTLFISIAASDLFIYFTHINKCNLSILKILWFVPSIVLILGLIIIMFGNKQAYMIDKAHIGSFYFMFCLSLTIPKCAFSVIYALKYLVSYLTHKDLTTVFTIISSIVAVSIFFIIAYGTIYGWKRYIVKEVKITSGMIPEQFNNFKIVHISDIHASTWTCSPNSLQKIVDKINSLHPDAVMFTGDLITHKTSEMSELADILKQIKAKYGVFSVLGNHDYSPYYPWKNIMDKKKNFQDLLKTQEYMGWKLLNNEHTYLTKGNDSICIIGVENWGEPPFSKYGNLPKAIQNVEDNTYKILLSHNPSHWKAEALDYKINLTLSGHTHAMQLKIGNMSLSKLRYKEWSGLYKEKNKYLYVNEGLGCTLIPFRFGTWPEITLITLKRNDA